MKRKTIVCLTAVSLMLWIATCFLWVRSRSGVDEATLRYDRYLANGRAASNAVYLTSDNRLWINVSAGSVEPYNGHLVWGYHVNADRSGGYPRFSYERSRYASNVFAFDGRSPTNDQSMSRWGPIRWQNYRRSGNGEQFRLITVGIPHWLVAAFFLVLPLRGLYVLRRASRTVAVAESEGEQADAPGPGGAMLSIVAGAFALCGRWRGIGIGNASHRRAG